MVFRDLAVVDALPNAAVGGLYRPRVTATPQTRRAHVRSRQRWPWGCRHRAAPTWLEASPSPQTNVHSDAMAAATSGARQGDPPDGAIAVASGTAES